MDGVSFFFSSVLSWLYRLTGFVWNSILSIQVNGIKLYIWILGILLIGGALALILRFKPHAPDTESGLRSVSRFRSRSAESRPSRGMGSSTNIRHRSFVD